MFPASPVRVAREVDGVWIRWMTGPEGLSVLPVCREDWPWNNGKWYLDGVDSNLNLEWPKVFEKFPSAIHFIFGSLEM